MSENGNSNQKRKIVHYSILHHDFEYSDSFVMKVQSDNEERQACEIIAEIYGGDENDKHIITTNLLKNGTATAFGATIDDVRIQDLETIIVLVRGGVIQNIKNIPESIRIQVHDYDTDTLTDEIVLASTKPDQDGDIYVESIWTSND